MRGRTRGIDRIAGLLSFPERLAVALELGTLASQQSPHDLPDRCDTD